MSKAFKTKGVHHLGLTVPDVDETKRFFVNVLGYDFVGKRDDYPAAFVTDGTTMITLWQTVDPNSIVPFDRKNVVGLHHLAIEVDHSDLDVAFARLLTDEHAHIEFPPQARGDKGARHLMCNIPGGIRLELFAV